AAIPAGRKHEACVLVLCTRPAEGTKGMDALGGIQFQVPNGGHWDYRKGKNDGGGKEYTTIKKVKFNNREWARVEIVVDGSKGIARMAVAQPVGSKAVEVLDFNDPTAAKTGPFALQIHNDGLFDEYANIAVEVNPASEDLITTK
ncbi:MAG TPA: family 16 glycoside hydrolase, partial [Tepidisphaeraceae bacterium]|nr:family 16 glycoside hydrolase [Tepidisphaeraceae bacterium]